MSKTKTILNRLLEKEKLLKIAQEIEHNEGEVDKATADQMAEEIFSKLFDQALEETGIKNLS